MGARHVTRTDRIIADQGDTARAKHEPQAFAPRDRRPDVSRVACCLQVLPTPQGLPQVGGSNGRCEAVVTRAVTSSEPSAKLATLAARVHVNEGTLARSLLSSAIDGLDPDPVNVAVLLDGIDGAFERAQLGVEQATAGDTIALDEL